MEKNPRIYEGDYNKLVDTFSQDEHLKDFYDWEHPEGMKKMSASQYWFALRLWRNNEYMQLKKFLDQYLTIIYEKTL